MIRDNQYERPAIGALLGGLVGDVQDLVRGEVKLARAEFDQKFDRLMTAGIWLLGGALVSFAGLVVLLQAIAAALAYVVPVWLSLLIVGVVIIGIGALVARSGLEALSLKSLRPVRTAANLNKDARMLKEHA